jgi:hypothetical protein
MPPGQVLAGHKAQPTSKNDGLKTPGSSLHSASQGLTETLCQAQCSHGVDTLQQAGGTGHMQGPETPSTPLRP